MGIDWESPAVLMAQGVAFLKLMHVLAGIYFWEFISSLGFDWNYLTGKKKFHWPMTFYFLGRYCLLFSLTGILIALDTTTKINCQALYTFNQVFGNAAVGLASINLALRTMAIWHMDRTIVILLTLIILGHWTLILQGVLLTAVWVDGQGCVITHTKNNILAATFIYSMSFDLVVMILSFIKLYSRRGHSQIVSLIFKDGLIYFFIAFLANFIATVFMCLSLNAIMSVIFNVPAAIGSTIVASRAVRRLNRFSSDRAEVYNSGARSGNTRKDPTLNSGHMAPAHAFAVSYPKVADPEAAEIHVQMDTFTVADSQKAESNVSDVDASSAYERKHGAL